MIRPLFFYKKTLKKFLEKCDVSRFNDWFAPPIWYNNVTRLREIPTKTKIKFRVVTYHKKEKSK